MSEENRTSGITTIRRYSHDFYSEIKEPATKIMMTNSSTILEELKTLLTEGLPSDADVNFLESQLRRYYSALKQKKERNASDSLGNVKSFIQKAEVNNTRRRGGTPGKETKMRPKLEILELYNEIVHELRLEGMEVDTQNLKDDNDGNADKNQNN